jgi:hypothetical protein
LAACSTAAQRQSVQLTGKAIEAKEANKACLGEIAANPQYATIAKHIPLDGSQPTLEQKADQSLATTQEVKAILAWRTDFTKCRQSYTEAVQGIAPAMVPALLEAQSASDAVWVKVVHRELAWGGALQQLSDIQAAVAAKGTQVAQEIQTDLQRQNQAELAQRQAALAAFGDAMQNAADSMQRQQMINAMNRPRTTNCSVFGNTASCTTY